MAILLLLCDGFGNWMEVINPRFSLLVKGVFHVRVDGDFELQVVLHWGAWRICGRVLVTTKWQPGDSMRIEDNLLVPFWIFLLEFPAFLWNR